MTRTSLFFRRLSLLLAVLAVAGFSQTFYLRSALGTEGSLTSLMLAHGMAYTAWVVLLVVQTELIYTRNPDIHRKLGYASVALVVTMMGLSAQLALVRTREWLEDPSFDSADVLAFLLTPTTTIVYFSLMFAAAVWFRHRSRTHKRLLMIGSFDLFTPAISRLPFITTLGPWWQAGLTDLLLVALMIHDWHSFKRIHPATLIGGGLLIACQVGRELLAYTDWWFTIAVWLVE